MSERVEWLRAAEERLEKAQKEQFAGELEQVFPNAEKIHVRQRFAGFQDRKAEKLVLGVEVREPKSFHSYIVKLGRRAEVEQDYVGYQKCVLDGNFASRIFVRVDKRKLKDVDRIAILYEDAYQFYTAADGQPGVHTLEEVVKWAVKDDKPDPISVERVIRQIFSDLNRWFYADAREDAAEARTFFHRRLNRGAPGKDYLAKWGTEEDRRDLRRDLIWLFCGRDTPDFIQNPYYTDPYDYVCWALEKSDRLPGTLIGCSHGDLHARNILVGVQRGEAEYPAIFDYGEMRPNNVIVWDFVKLEMELKVRLLEHLYESDETVRDTLRKSLPKDIEPLLPNLAAHPAAYFDTRVHRIERLAYFHEFERQLTRLTNRIGEGAPDPPDPPGGRDIMGHQKLNRALALFTRIRQQAALYLGNNTRLQWRDEYLFALAVYGLYTARFANYTKLESECAFVAAGVAINEIERIRRVGQLQFTELLEGKSEPWKTDEALPFCSYRPVLAYAHTLRLGHRSKRSIHCALEIINHAAHSFPDSVPVLSERALILSVNGKQNEALASVRSLQNLCQIFQDVETISRIGAAYKKMADDMLCAQPTSHADLKEHNLAFHHYRLGFERYYEAYQINRHYYPGINAAMLSHLIGDVAKSKELAAEIRAKHPKLDIGSLETNERFWFYCTSGEASVYLGDTDEAFSAYRYALSLLDSKQLGMVQTAYDQLCRLHWMNLPTADLCGLFRQQFPALKPGPLGDCK